MIKTFADKHTRTLFETGRSKRLPPDILRRAVRKLEYVDLATRLDDLRVPRGNRLHALRADRAGQHAIAINEQWRICFRFEVGDAYEVEVTAPNIVFLDFTGDGIPDPFPLDETGNGSLRFGDYFLNIYSATGKLGNGPSRVPGPTK